MKNEVKQWEAGDDAAQDKAIATLAEFTGSTLTESIPSTIDNGGEDVFVEECKKDGCNCEEEFKDYP